MSTMLFHHFSIEKLTFYLFSVKEQQELDFQSSEKNFLFNLSFDGVFKTPSFDGQIRDLQVGLV